MQEFCCMFFYTNVQGNAELGCGVESIEGAFKACRPYFRTRQGTPIRRSFRQ